MKLTKKQERFCQECAAGKSGSEAYRKAYRYDRTDPQASYQLAWRLRKNPAVQQRIAELKEQRLAEDLALDKHLQRLAELRDLAMEKGNYAAAIPAEIAMGKVSGLPELAKVKIMEMKERKKNEEEKEVRIVLF